MSSSTAQGRRIALIALGDGRYVAVELDEDGGERSRVPLGGSELLTWVAELEKTEAPRWIIRSARDIYPMLLAGGVRLGRTHDLLLCHAILRDTDAVARPLPPSAAWVRREPTDAAPALFDVVEHDHADDPVVEALDQFRAQRRVIDQERDGRLTLLCAAESAGGLIAEEMRAAGLPWDEGVHDAILTETLGTRPAAGGLPSRMVELGDRVRAILSDSTLHLDSQPKLLRALHRVGVHVESTSRWELASQSHAVVEPLLAYKKLSRLLSANGWAWLAEWVHDRRFRPVYIPGGVVTGRWASAGGGALQLPRSLRLLLSAPTRAGPWWSPTWRNWSRGCWRPWPPMRPWRAQPRGVTCTRESWHPVPSVPARRRSTPCSARCTAPPPETAAAWCRGCARSIRGRWRWSTRPRAPVRTAEWCRPGWVAPRRGRRRSGRNSSRGPRGRMPIPPRSPWPGGEPGTGVGSPATSSCRGRRPSGR